MPWEYYNKYESWTGMYTAWLTFCNTSNYSDFKYLNIIPISIFQHYKLITRQNPLPFYANWSQKDNCRILKAILQVLIYKALYDKSYLESKTTMTTGESSCLISFTWAPLTCSERGGSEKFKMKIYVSSGIRTHIASVHDRKVRAP